VDDSNYSAMGTRFLTLNDVPLLLVVLGSQKHLSDKAPTGLFRYSFTDVMKVPIHIFSPSSKSVQVGNKVLVFPTLRITFIVAN